MLDDDCPAFAEHANVSAAQNTARLIKFACFGTLRIRIAIGDPRRLTVPLMDRVSDEVSASGYSEALVP